MNFVSFYAGWLACVAGAGRGWLWEGPVAASVLLLVHLSLAPQRRREGALIIAAGVLGFAVDTLQASAGLYAFTGTSVLPWLCPPWMVALWALFASTLNSSMGWLAGRYRLAVVLGALCGPVSYLAGERLGAITLSSSTPTSLGGIAVVWALVMPALLWIREALSQAGPDTAADRGRLSRATRLIPGALVVVLATSLSGVAAEIEGVRFADQVRSHDVTMQLRCVGLLRYKVFIKAYVAALYLGDGAVADDVFADVPKRLELSYFWSIKGADFGRAGDEILKRNVDERTLTTLRPRLERINGWYRDVKPGDRYALTYLPGVGTQLALNGNEVGVIDGADFAKAYFRIWLGDEPIDARLRAQLLDCRRDIADQGRAVGTARARSSER
ncbi:MAG: DUF2878 family protein [Candidatus Binatia bacterium]